MKWLQKPAFGNFEIHFERSLAYFICVVIFISCIIDKRNFTLVYGQLEFLPSLPPPPQNNNSFTNQEACCEVLLWAHDFFRLTAERLVRGK